MARSIFSVGQINTYIKNMFTQDYLLCRVAVKGEVSNCKYHPSGHIYFTLKDETGSLACVMFAGSRRGGLAFPMKNGDNVVAEGNITIYERDGRYQLYARQITLQGAGDLYLKFEQLKQKLQEMGMFAQEYKKPVPAYIRTLGIVTASSGAAVRDIMNITRRRNPYVQMILYPALVQGEGAAQSIANGIRALDEYGVDVMIVGRGGGSIEDLWAFNEEIVARAIFHCSVPVISAVGHETDTTIADFVADLRAPTPSAAAELAVFEYRQVEAVLDENEKVLRRLMEQVISRKRQQLAHQALLLRRSSPMQKLQGQQQFFADGEIRLQMRMRQILDQKRHRFALLTERLAGLSPYMKLTGGCGYVTDADGEAVRSVSRLETGDEISVRLADGRVKAVVTEKQVEVQ